jgi:hypothetical protein
MALRQPNISDLRAHLADSLARCAFGSASPKFFRASVAATPNRSFLTALRSGEVNRTLARVRGATTNLQCGTKGEPAGGFYKQAAEDQFAYSENFPHTLRKVVSVRKFSSACGETTGAAHRRPFCSLLGTAYGRSRWIPADRRAIVAFGPIHSRGLGELSMHSPFMLHS